LSAPRSMLPRARQGRWHRLQRFIVVWTSLVLLTALPASAAPQAEEFWFYPLSDPDARMAALQAGEADVLPLLAEGDLSPWEAAETGPRLAIAVAPGSNLCHIGFNLREWPVSDRAFRQALAAAIDAREVAREALGELAFPAAGYLPAYDPFF